MIDLKTIARLLLLVVAGLLSSCIDGREEYWLQADGSGRAEITYQVPPAVATAHGGEAGLRNLLEDFLGKTPQITASSVEVTTRDRRVHVTLRASFNSAHELTDLASANTLDALPSAVSHLVGEVSADLRGRTLDFSRTVRPANALPGSAFLPSSQFDGHRLLYIMHLPVVPVTSNATRVENAGRTLVWDIPLAQALRGPVTTRFEMNAPIPWRLVSAFVAPLSLAAGGWFTFRQRIRRRRFPDGNPGNPVL